MDTKHTCNQSIPNIISKSSISSSTRSTKENLLGNIIGQFLYTLFAITYSPTGVDTINVSCNISGKISNFLATRGVKNDKVAPGSSKEYTSREKTFNIPVTKSGEVSCSPLERRA